MRQPTFMIWFFGLLAIVAAAAPTTASDPAPTRPADPAVVEIDWPQSAGERRRPLVEFNHELHTKALEAEGCKTCHVIDDNGFDPSLAAVAGGDNDDALMDAYHDRCVGCHQRMSGEGRKSGPVTCGECHVRRAEELPARPPMSFDLSLHGRHSQAYPDDCGKCHHVWDEATEKLIYRKNTEEACRGCHGEVAVKDTPSLEDAVHRECVGCHLERGELGEEAGPTRCEGCHDPAMVAAIKPLDPIPRLLRGQPNSLWVAGPDASWPMVAFNHERHELRAQSCSGCHHDRIKACADCHTPRTGADGGGVTLERAHHEPGSTWSCNGCHHAAAVEGDCAGCHRDTTVAVDPERGCMICHDGPPRRADVPPPELPDGSPPVPELDALPAASDDLPEEVTIDLLVDRYQPSRMPHTKIVRRLDAGVRESGLARMFHGSTETMCAGCHHHSPVGERPPKCSACHGEEAGATIDRPSLKVAYHRQCVSCHQKLNLKVGCTDCHEAKEGQS